MSDNFRQAYAELTDYVSSRPEIEIGESVISIPEDVRPRFYELFNAARETFVGEKIPTLLNKAKILLDGYREAEQNAIGLLTLDEISMDAGLQRFLHDPKICLARDLFDPLFDLLKGRETVESFEKKALDKILAPFPALYRGGYEKWVILSLVKLLEADKAFQASVRQLYPGERAKSAAYAPLEEALSPQESKSLSFAHPRNAVFAVPDFIVHSTKLDRYVGFRSEFKGALFNASNASRQREWNSVDSNLLMALEPGLAFIYVAEQAEDIALAADVTRICRPDLILWCIDPENLSQQEAVKRITSQHRMIRPLKGSCVVAQGVWPEQSGAPPDAGAGKPDIQQEPGEQAEKIHFLEAGFEPSRLKHVIDAILSYKIGAEIT